MKLSKLISISMLAAASIFPLASQANEAQTLGTCLVDSLNGKERKALIKWVYFSMSSHPELEKFIVASNEDITGSNQTMGTLVTRLFTEDCPKEAIAANKADPLAIQKAFEFVGQVAMQELMTNPNVMTSITQYIHYSDQNKINSLFVE